MADTKKYASPAGPLAALRWILLVPVNLALIVAFQAFFIHTHAAPLTPESVAALPEFAGCEILDVAGPEVDADSLGGTTTPSWVLYRNAAGETHVVRVEWSLPLPRYRIEKNVDFLIPDGESPYTLTARNWLGQDNVTVENGQTITRWGTTGAVRQTSDAVRNYVLLTLGLFLLEAAVYYFLRDRRNRRRGKTE